MSFNDFLSPIRESSVGIYNNAASVGARQAGLFLSVEVWLDSLFSYAASHQVMIHRQTWQRDRHFFEKKKKVLIFRGLQRKFRDSAALNVRSHVGRGLYETQFTLV